MNRIFLVTTLFFLSIFLIWNAHRNESALDEAKETGRNEYRDEIIKGIFQGIDHNPCLVLRFSTMEYEEKDPSYEGMIREMVAKEGGRAEEFVSVECGEVGDALNQQLLL